MVGLAVDLAGGLGWVWLWPQQAQSCGMHRRAGLGTQVTACTSPTQLPWVPPAVSRAETISLTSHPAPMTQGDGPAWSPPHTQPSCPLTPLCCSPSPCEGTSHHSWACPQGHSQSLLAPSEGQVGADWGTATAHPPQEPPARDGQRTTELWCHCSVPTSGSVASPISSWHPVGASRVVSMHPRAQVLLSHPMQPAKTWTPPPFTRDL